MICAACATGTPPQGDPVWQGLGFPVLPPIADADPSVRHEVTVGVPTGLKVERTADTLSITVDRDSLETTRIMVGTNMVIGVRSELFVYSEGETRPTQGRSYGRGGDFNLGTSILHTKEGDIPMPGTNYVIEMDLAIFETDIPPQHRWSPQSKNYRILWERTLKEPVE
jgi:hypothetical protein